MATLCNIKLTDTVEVAMGSEQGETSKTTSLKPVVTNTTTSLASTSHPGSLVWVLDPDGSTRKALKQHFESISWKCLAFQNHQQLDDILEETTPDILVLEQQLHERIGNDVIRLLRSSGHRFPVIILSTQAAQDDRIAGLEAGASDYIAKPFAIRELALRIEIHLTTSKGPARRIREASETHQIMNAEFKPSQGIIQANGKTVTLSRGDSAILTALCEASGLTLSREALARASGSLVDTRNSRSLDMRISKLRKVFEDLDGELSECIKSVRGRGYRLATESSGNEHILGRAC